MSVWLKPTLAASDIIYSNEWHQPETNKMVQKFGVKIKFPAPQQSGISLNNLHGENVNPSALSVFFESHSQFCHTQRSEKSSFFFFFF